MVQSVLTDEGRSWSVAMVAAAGPATHDALNVSERACKKSQGNQKAPEPQTCITRGSSRCFLSSGCTAAEGTHWAGKQVCEGPP